MKRITKKFLDGVLKDLTHTSITGHGFELDKIYTDCVTGDKYQIVDIQDVDIDLTKF